MASGMLLAALVLAPPPAGATFRDDGRDMRVLGPVRRPHDPMIPGRVLVARGDQPRDYGWIWQQTFRDYGVPVLIVCEDRDGNPWLYPPARVWTLLPPRRPPPP